MCQQKKSNRVLLQGEMASPDCPMTKRPTQRGLQRLLELSTISYGSICQIIHHVSWEHPSPAIDFIKRGSTAEVSTVEMGTAEVGSAEVGSIEVDTAEVGSAEVGMAEVRPNTRMLFPPLIPNIYPLFKDIKMFLLCHCVSPSFLSIFGHLTCICDPNSGYVNCIICFPPCGI
jgi:hypothetical protein